MIARWARHVLWRPFELTCRRSPFVPLTSTVGTPCEGVRIISSGNWVTRAITRLGGGYDYSVCYVVDDELLIDSGYAWAARTLERTLDELGLAGRIRTVVNTHAHEDHTGNNDVLVARHGATVYAHPAAIPQIRHPTSLPWYRHFMFGPPSAVSVRPVPRRIETQHRALDVLDMPGHSPGHVCLFEAERRWLFSGDLFVSASLDSQLKEVDGLAWIRSLETAIELAPAALFDGHGCVVLGEAPIRELLCQKHAFLCGFRDRVLAAATSARSIADVTRDVFSDESFVNKASLGEGWLSLLTASDFSRSHVVGSFLHGSQATEPSPLPRLTP